MKVNEDAETRGLRDLVTPTDANAARNGALSNIVGVRPADLIDNKHTRELAGGITRPTLIQWRELRGFPAPLATPHVTGELWDVREVRAWLAAHPPLEDDPGVRFSRR